MAGSGKVSQADLHNLVHHMSKNAYRAKESTVMDEKVLSHCLNMFGTDYKYSVIDNRGGEKCNHYPSKLVLLEYECKDASTHHSHESVYNMHSMSEMFTKARFARCRTRFVMPVILVEGKHICRSATISSGGEMYGRLGINIMFNNGGSVPNQGASRTTDGNQNEGDSQLFDRIRGQDIKLLKEFNVKHICDLMLENKKVKYFVNVTSSEKVDKLNRYAEFSVWSLPYPGCEFFKTWRDRDYNGERSVFDWSQDFVNSKLELPNERHLRVPSIHWNEYKSWTLIQITQNYLHVMLQHIQQGDSGLLVHCISGWDRTPLFVSLLRLSLWADGLVHKSLSALEILYLTVAYDWYQFGHNLPDRLQKGEEIFFFCFYFLKYIQEDEFVVRFPHQTVRQQQRARCRHVSRTDSESALLAAGGAAGLLLDDCDFPPFGSSTSLYSDISHTSDSHTDTPPQLFMVGGPDEEGVMTSLHAATGTASYSSHPMSVPDRRDIASGSAPQSAVRERSGSGCRENSPTVGSWQVITGTGSYAASSSLSSPLQPTLLQSRGQGSASAAELSTGRSSGSSGGAELTRNSLSFSELAEYEPTDRRRRLEEVRVLFYNAYGSTVGFKNGPDTPPGGITSLFDMFTEKVVAFGNKLA